METLAELLKHVDSLLLLLGFFPLITALLGRVSTKWVVVEPNGRQRIALGLMGCILLAAGVSHVVAPWSLTPPSCTGLTRDMLMADKGRFEWQWAGQNWKGSTVFRDDGPSDVTIDVNIRKESLVEKDGRLYFELSPEVFSTISSGEVTVRPSGVELKGLTVKRTRFAPIELNGRVIEGFEATGSERILITGELKPVTAIAGKIKYKNLDTGREWFGDMVLVQYEQHVYYD